MTATSDLAVLAAVLLARFLLPLLIPRFPLPGILLCLLVDAADQTILQSLTRLPLSEYQTYDKALDVYYLTIAYISTLRNWTNRLAFQVGRFLFYYRLAGVVLFELAGYRPLLLIFPNTFEYFFIFYEVVRLRWDPDRLGMKALIGTAAAIWLLVKLPQEWWIHVARLDTTDVIKTRTFGLPVDASWAEAAAARPLVVVAAVALVALLGYAAWRLFPRLPRPDRALRLAADPLPANADEVQERRAIAARFSRMFDATLVEKIALVTLVSVVFAQILPGVVAPTQELALGVALLVLVNAALSHELARRGSDWPSALREFLALTGVNTTLVVSFNILFPQAGGAVLTRNALFFVLLLSLMIALFDQYHTVHLARLLPEE